MTVNYYNALTAIVFSWVNTSPLGSTLVLFLVFESPAHLQGVGVTR